MKLGTHFKKAATVLKDRDFWDSAAFVAVAVAVPMAIDAYFLLSRK